MPALITEPNLADADCVCSALIAAHEGLSAYESAALDARLIVILANHVGDAAVLRQALDAARRDPPNRKN